MTPRPTKWMLPGTFLLSKQCDLNHCKMLFTSTCSELSATISLRSKRCHVVEPVCFTFSKCSNADTNKSSSSRSRKLRFATFQYLSSSCSSEVYHDSLTLLWQIHYLPMLLDIHHQNRTRWWSWRWKEKLYPSSWSLCSQHLRQSRWLRRYERFY